jgi:hypothetical protein
MRMRSLTLVTIASIVILATVLCGCTTSTNTSPEASVTSPTTTVTASSTPTSSAAAAPGVTQTSNGYTVTGNSGANEQTVALKAGDYTFHIMLSDFSKADSGQAYLTGTGAIAGQQVMLVVFTDSIWSSDMTVTKTIPADGNYKLHVSYLNSWEVDISQ